MSWISNAFKKIQKRFVLVLIDKAINKITITCKHYHIEVILKEDIIVEEKKISTRSKLGKIKLSKKAVEHSKKL